MKGKCVLTGFAVFAAALMLMTPCMARPVAEQTNIEAVENFEQELITSLENLDAKLSRDRTAVYLIESIQSDPVVARYVQKIDQVETSEEAIAIFESLSTYLEGSAEAIQLGELIEEDYSIEAQAVAEELEIINTETSVADTPWWLSFSFIKFVVTVFLYWLIHQDWFWDIIFWLDDLFDGDGDGGGGTPSY